MLKLRLNNTASTWLDLGNGVRVQVPPSSTAALRAAEFAGFRAYGTAKEDMEMAGRDPAAPDAIGELEGMFAQARIRSLASRIEAWEGLGGDDGQPLPISPEALDAFAAHPALGGAFARAYDASSVELVMEGNGSAPSTGGKPRGAKATAAAASAAAPSAPAS
jgi:hypothetical protein